MIYSRRSTLYSMHKFLLSSSNILRLYDKHSPNDTYHFVVDNKTQKLATTDFNNINSYYHKQPLVHIHLQDYRPCLNGYCMAGKCIESKSKRILRFWTPVHYSKHKNLGRYHFLLTCIFSDFLLKFVLFSSLNIILIIEKRIF